MHNSIFFLKQISYTKPVAEHLIALIAYITLLIAKKSKEKKKLRRWERKRLIAVCELKCNNVYIFWQFIIFETTSSSNEKQVLHE